MGIYNKKITHAEIIKHIKKCGKSNGYQHFSIVVPKKYLKYLSCEYEKKPVNGADYGNDIYLTVYKDCYLVCWKKN
jgi:hypothetical protein